MQNGKFSNQVSQSSIQNIEEDDHETTGKFVGNPYQNRDKYNLDTESEYTIVAD